MMGTIGGIVTTAFLIGLSAFAWWVIRPPRITPEREPASEGGLAPGGGDDGGGGDGGG